MSTKSNIRPQLTEWPLDQAVRRAWAALTEEQRQALRGAASRPMPQVGHNEEAVKDGLRKFTQAGRKL